MTSNAFNLAKILDNGTTNISSSVIASDIAGTYLTQIANPAALSIANNTPGDKVFSTSNNKLFLWTGNAWVTMSTTNEFPNVPTGILDNYTLATDGTPTSITAVSTDPDGTTVTFSYETIGLLNEAAIAQADNVFVVYPTTNTSYGGTFDLIIKATSNGETIGKKTTFTLSF
jgi:hypothetical protein|tara:strand:+ start:668 stop:1183 length:516 start_codon:yes stop_codon:yes gene_type:complete